MNLQSFDMALILSFLMCVVGYMWVGTAPYAYAYALRPSRYIAYEIQ